MKKWGQTLRAGPTRGRGLRVKARSWLRWNRRVDRDRRVGGVGGRRDRGPRALALVGRLSVGLVLGVGVGVGAAIAGNASLGLVVLRVRIADRVAVRPRT